MAGGRRETATELPSVKVRRAKVTLWSLRWTCRPERTRSCTSDRNVRKTQGLRRNLGDCQRLTEVSLGQDRS